MALAIRTYGIGVGGDSGHSAAGRERAGGNGAGGGGEEVAQNEGGDGAGGIGDVMNTPEDGPEVHDAGAEGDGDQSMGAKFFQLLLGSGSSLLEPALAHVFSGLAESPCRYLVGGARCALDGGRRGGRRADTGERRRGGPEGVA